MDPMMMMMLASMAKEALAPPKPIMPTGSAPPAPQMQQVQNVPTFDFMGAGAGGGAPIDPMELSQTTGAASPAAAMPGAAATPVASPLDGLSRLGADTSADDVEIGKALLGSPELATTGQGMETAGSATGTALSPPVTDPTLGGVAGETMAAAAGAGAAKPGFDINSIFKGLGGVKAPPPVTPIMHGGNTGGARPPEVSAKMGSSVAINPILQMLFGSGQKPMGLPFPALGQLLRGA